MSIVQNTMLVTGNQTELSNFLESNGKSCQSSEHPELKLGPDNTIIAQDAESIRYRFSTDDPSLQKCFLGLSSRWPTLSFMVSSDRPEGGLVKWMRDGKVLDTKIWGEPTVYRVSDDYYV